MRRQSAGVDVKCNTTGAFISALTASRAFTNSFDGSSNTFRTFAPSENFVIQSVR
jgi:hypothetical protein